MSALAVYWARREVVGQFRECRREIAGYLRALIDWVNTDPWPRDRRFGGPVLTPAAIERKLRVSAPGRAGEEDLDADDLAQQCRRLVVLGGPGSGKTWLAKRTARSCAERALEAMAAGAGLDDVELPLYTTCSRLFGAEGDIREAAVASALEQLGDLGGPKVSAELRTFFTERNTPTVLVIDSLDEAHGSQQRLRQADTLPWRIVLTTRPSLWNQQLAIDDTDDSHRVGELQPLLYPEDVDPFIRRWFDHQPERGEDLAAEIARRPDLHQAATVPLILAFYCIVGGRVPLPEFRRDLYGRVLNRVLTGRWRGDEDRQPDVGVCLQTLRDWAWPGAEARHPVSGMGTWTEDILTGHAGLGEAEQDALDHVAMPLGPADVDTGQTLRRFIHRSIREHLVADHVARLPVGQAAEVLLPHLWHDPDWEYAAPAAIAMNPQHDQLLRDLVCQAARSEQLQGDLSVIDAGWDFRGLLARVVSESSETDWSPEIAGMISRARVDLAMSGRFDALGGGALWASSNGHIREVLFRLLADPANGWAAEKLVAGVVQLAATADDRRQVRDALLGLLPGYGSGYEAARFVRKVVSGVVQVARTAEEKRQVRDALLKLLPGQSGGWVADELVTGLSQLSPTAHDKRQARDALLGLVPGQSGGWETAWLVGRAVQLAATDEDKRETRDMLLGLLPGQPGGWVADEMIACVNRLGPAAEDNRHACDALPMLQPRQAKASTASDPASWVSWRALAAGDNRQTRNTLLAVQGNGHLAAGLACRVTMLDPTAEDKRQAREILLRLLARPLGGLLAARLAGWVSRLDPTAEDKRQARDVLVRQLAAQTDGRAAQELADWVSRLDPPPKDKRQTRDALISLLARRPDAPLAPDLLSRVVQLAATAEYKRQTRDALLGMLSATKSAPARPMGWWERWSSSRPRPRTSAGPSANFWTC